MTFLKRGKPNETIYLFAFGVLFLAGCASTPTIKDIVAPSTTGGSAKPASWQVLRTGLEKKSVSELLDGHTYNALILRMNTKKTHWKLGYQKEARRLDEWDQTLQSDVIINGSYFTEDFVPTGLFRQDGITVSSTSYDGSTVGTVAIAKGSLSLLPSVNDAPLDADLFQSFPLLIRQDQKRAIAEDTQKIARRTILAQDDGRWTYIIVFDTTPLSLFDAEDLIQRFKLNLVWALNLDGGPSTGLIAHDDEFPVNILPASALPIVLSAQVD